jgi:hypothetical protein
MKSHVNKKNVKSFCLCLDSDSDSGSDNEGIFFSVHEHRQRQKLQLIKQTRVPLGQSKVTISLSINQGTISLSTPARVRAIIVVTH